MPTVKVAADCAAAVENAFAYVNDYRNLPKYITEVHAFTPVTEQDAGLGAIFDTDFKLGPVALSSQLEIVRWEQGRLLAVRSRRGFEIESTFEFHPRNERLCTVDAVVELRVPGGLAGKMLGKTIEPFIKIAVKHSTHNLTTQIEDYQRSLEG